MLNEAKPNPEKPAAEEEIDPSDETPDVIVDEEGETIVQPPRSRRRLVKRILLWTALAFLALLLILALTAPLSKSLKPIGAPSLTLLSADGQVIARKGSVTDAPVRAEQLPPHIPQAFIAIEDRRFYEHLGIDPWGIMRAMGRNLAAGSVEEGGSTITQQLAKLSFLSSDQTAARKLQEAILAPWLEAWLSKDEILSRYLSSVYFGDNVYGLRAASKYYFNREPEALTVEQAALLAGLVKAPSRLAPTKNLADARARGKIVEGAMVRAGFIDAAAAEKLPQVKLSLGPVKEVPSGTYFTDWLFQNELADRDDGYGEQIIRTTLEDRLQRQAAKAIRSVGTGGAQVALVAMRPDGRVVAMVGGRSYRSSPFNRVTQAKRQPGSTFKLFVYLAALRAGYSPTNPINDVPIRVGNWSPENYEGVYRGTISLRDAFAFSSNVAAVQLAQRVGHERVVQAARDLGVTSEIETGPAMALGTSSLTLMEMTRAFAAVANGAYPVKPRGLPETEAGGGTPFEGSTREQMLELLHAVTAQGTGRAAALPVQTFGKTGTSQDSRDAYFIGFAGNLVTGVWIGHDDNRPMGKVGGGGIPALIWRAFMAEAVKGDEAAAATIVEQTEVPLPVAEPIPGEALPPVVTDYDVETAPLDATVPVEDPAALPAETPVVDVAPPAPPVPAGSQPPVQAPPQERPQPGQRAIPTVRPPPPPPPEEAEEEEPEEDPPT